MDDVVKTWVEGYRRAWETNDPDDIRALFTDEAEYFLTPSAPPWRGHGEIVAGWLHHQDEPGTTTFEWSPVVAHDGVAVVRCVTGYPSGSKFGTYDNLWVVRFASDGRAREFTDWWVERRA